jgi:hypothetical protein
MAGFWNPTGVYPVEVAAAPRRGGAGCARGQRERARRRRGRAGLADVPARVPLKVLDDTIQPFPSFTGIYDAAVEALRMQIADMPWPAGPMAAQTASPSG